MSSSDVAGGRAVSSTSAPRPLSRLDARVALLAGVYAGAGSLAAFAFAQSYKHIYDLGRAHHQDGWTSLLLPLSVDVVIVVATLIMILQRTYDEKPAGLAKWMPRVMLYTGIVATVGANLLYGLPYGPLTAGLSSWPGVVFAGVVEVVMVAVRPGQRAAVKRTVVSAGQPPVPASSIEAARIAFEASLAGGNPIAAYTLHKRYNIPSSQASKIVAAAKAALNGAGHD